MDSKHDDVALFRFKLIAPLLAESGIAQKDYLLKITSQEHRPPGVDMPVRFKPSTIKKWLYRYRKHGFQALVKNRRKDHNCFRKIPPELAQKIIALAEEYDFRTVRTLYGYLIEIEALDPKKCTYATLVNFVNRHELFSAPMLRKERKSFEKRAVNMLWVGDFLYGPKVRHEKKTLQSYLFTMLDDHSRFPVGAAWSVTQDSYAVECVLKKALRTYGIPAKIYLDNGKVFVEKRLITIGARIGFTIVHSAVGDAASRGKIERFFRTVRDKFLDRFLFDYRDGRVPEFITLTSEFDRWIYEAYMHVRHSKIDDSPHNRYMRGVSKTAIRYVIDDALTRAFYVDITRKVGNSALVSVDNVEYEVPGKYIGKTITLFRDNDRTDNALLLFDDTTMSYVDVRPVDRAQNAEFPIRYHDDKNNF